MSNAKRTPPPVLAALIEMERLAAHLSKDAKRLAKAGTPKLTLQYGCDTRTVESPPAVMFAAAAEFAHTASLIPQFVWELRAAYWKEQREPKSKRAAPIQSRKHARLSRKASKR